MPSNLDGWFAMTHDSTMFLIAVFFLGIVLGCLLAWFLLRARIAEQRNDGQKLLQDYQREAILHVTAATKLEESQKNTKERFADLEKAHEKLKQSFEQLSATALKKNNELFLDAAKGVVTPIGESLGKMDAQIRELESKREGAYGALRQQILALAEGQSKLAKETEGLSRALHAPTVRGRWGEIQLRRVVELAGMVAHCDFEEQKSGDGQDGGRPDLVVKLPGKKCIIVDAKVPLRAYLQAMEATDGDEREQRLKEHALQVRQHVQQLSKKAYWRNFQETPEFVVMFLPGDIFLSSALSCDPELLEMGVDQGVILATPTTLIALLRAVGYGWRQETLAENAAKISQLAQKLYERLGTMAEHFDKLGRSLRSSVDSYNQTLSSLESRVFATARKMSELGGAEEASKIKGLKSIESQTKSLSAPELVAGE